MTSDRWISSRLAFSLLVSALALPACQAGDAGPEGTPSPLAAACEPDDGGLVLPSHFCAILVSEGVGLARHLEVAPNGDLFIALRNGRGTRGGVLVLRDTNDDGRPDVEERWGENGGNDILLHGGYAYFASNDAVLRYPLSEGAMRPTGPVDTIVSSLPANRSHTAKSIAIDLDGNLFVSIGSPSNACQEQPRTPGSMGIDPCPQLDDRAGIWRFDVNRLGQTQTDGIRYATGLRNTVALRLSPIDGELYGVVHGRDQLGGEFRGLFNEYYTTEDNAEKPAEEFVHITEGSDFGWPYCYYDPATNEKLLAPEYGGTGEEIGRCTEMDQPIIGFPAHWAPNDLEFYTETQFPERYWNGAFIAFHGSWNRAPLPQQGYNVVFVPMTGGTPVGDWEIFADGFQASAGDQGTTRRPVGLSIGPDGSLFISESTGGRIWRVVYRGP